MYSFPFNPFESQPDIMRDGFIGRGGYGEVWRARWHGEVVAVKFLRHVTADTRRDFAAEVAKLEALQDLPYIVQIKGKNLHATQPYYWMELCGPTLDKWSGQYPKDDQVNLAFHLIRAIEELHRRGILHRDIKPPNILTRRVGDLIMPVIADFGTARSFDMSRPCHGTGTPVYTAKEIFEGAPFTPAADAYSLGLTLYELITGFPNRPFLDLGIPGHLVDLLRQMIDGDPRRRPTLTQARTRIEGIINQRSTSPFWHAVNSATTGEALFVAAAALGGWALLSGSKNS